MQQCYFVLKAYQYFTNLFNTDKNEVDTHSYRFSSFNSMFILKNHRSENQIKNNILLGFIFFIHTSCNIPFNEIEFKHKI